MINIPSLLNPVPCAYRPYTCISACCTCCEPKLTDDQKLTIDNFKNDTKDVWTGDSPFYKLTDTKVMYQRNRYLVPEILSKAKTKETPNFLLKAKTKFQETKSTKDLIEKYACRTGDCKPCSNTLNMNKRFTEVRKSGYEDVKAEAENDDGSGDAKTRCCGCSRKMDRVECHIDPILSVIPSMQ